MQPSDEELVLALRAGDVDSLGVLVSRWQEPLYRFTLRLLARPEDARDICQETFLRVLRQAGRFRDGARFSTWMYQIALNLCRDQMRRRRRWRWTPLADGPPGEDLNAGHEEIVRDTPADEADRQERRTLVVRALEDLPPDQREVLILKEFEGMKFREIAEILGCPESTVKSRMYYGLTGLRSALERRGFRSL